MKNADNGTRASRPQQKVRTSNTFLAATKASASKTTTKTKTSTLNSSKNTAQSPRSRSNQRSEPGGTPSKIPELTRSRSRSLCADGDGVKASPKLRTLSGDKQRAAALPSGVTFSSQVLEASINGTVTPKKLCVLSPSPSGSSESAPTSSAVSRQLPPGSTMPQATP